MTVQQWRARGSGRGSGGRNGRGRGRQEPSVPSSERSVGEATPRASVEDSAEGNDVEWSTADDGTRNQGYDWWQDRHWGAREWREDGWDGKWWSGDWWSWDYDGGWHSNVWRSRQEGWVARPEETTMVENGKWVGTYGSSYGTSSTARGDEDEGNYKGTSRTNEKLTVPEFSGEGSDEELGRSARSYLRKMNAWLKCTKMADQEKAVALYTNLSGKAWIFAEELDMEILSSPGGVTYFQDWVRVRFMELEVTKIGNVMTELFRRCRKKHEQSVRDFNLEFERLLLHLKELDCELPALVQAWLYMDKLRLSETEELALLSSVHNRYDVKLLQQAALLHDRAGGKKWEKGGGGHRWSRGHGEAKHVHMTNADDAPSEGEDSGEPNDNDIQSDVDLVSEAVAEGYHSAYMAFQDAKSKYREAMRGRGMDRDEMKRRNDARLQAAKAKSYCSACKRKGHWHRDPECPLRGRTAAQNNSSTGGEGVKTANECHVVHQCFMTASGEIEDEQSAVGGFDAESFAAKLRVMKDKSYCSRCKQRGHWSKDLECPLRGEDQQCFMTQDYEIEDEKGTFIKSKHQDLMLKAKPATLLAITDTACTKTVAGHAWFESYCKWADTFKWEVEIVEERDKFKFGASRVHESNFAVWCNFAVCKKPFRCKVAIVQCDVPLLLSRSALGKLGMIYHVEKQRADLTSLKIEGHPLEISPSGHPALCVTDFPESRVFEKIEWSPGLEVRLQKPEQNESDGAYKVLAAESERAFTPVFYPKKIDLEVENMLVGDNLSRTSFMTWWRNANQSRDFWIETPNQFIRVHVVPRTSPFDPSLWNTSLTSLKRKLLDRLSDFRRADVIPCHGDGLVQLQHSGQWMSTGVHAKHEEPFDQLWIGRSCFDKQQSQEVRSHVSARFDADVAMEDASRCAGGRAGRVPSGDSPEVDCSRTQANCGGAEGDALPKASCQSCNWTDQAQPRGAHEEGKGAGSYCPSEGNPRTSSENDSGGSATSQRASDDLRQVSKLVVPRGAGGLHALGGEGDQGEPELESRPEDVRGLGREGAGAPCNGDQEEGRGAASGGSGSQGKDSPARHVVNPKLEIFNVVEGFKRLGRIFGREANPGARVGGVPQYGDRSFGTRPEGIGGAGDTPCGLQAKAQDPSSGVTTALRADGAVHGAEVQNDKVFVENAALGHGVRGEAEDVKVSEYKEKIGLARSAGEECMLLTLEHEDVQEGAESEADFKDGIGHRTEVKYEAVPEENAAIGLGKRNESVKVVKNDLGKNYGETMKARATDAVKKRRQANKPLKKKLIGMANKLHQVLLTCAFAVGTMACEKIIEPGMDLWAEWSPNEDAVLPACLELFAGSSHVTEAFAKAKCGVLRPRDLLFGDDLRDPEVRREIIEEVKREKPQLIWAAPPCTLYCGFSRMNYTKQERRRRRRRERVFLEFIDELIVIQLAGGRDLVVENPMTSDMWKEPIMERWCKDPTMSFFRADLCHFGLKSVDGEDLLKKPVKLLATNKTYEEVLGQQCSQDHDRKVIQGKETKHSAEYPMAFAEAIVRATKAAIKVRHEVFVAESGVMVPVPEEEDEALVSLGSEDITFKGTVKANIAGALKKLHQNLGHPPNRELVKHLRLAGAGEEMLTGAQGLRCRTCDRCADPRPHKVAKPAAMLDFNEAVALDIIFLDTCESSKNYALNMVDLASTYQVAIPIENRKSATVADAFYKYWISWAGVPGRLVLDLDGCFQESFWELTSDHSIAMRAAAGQAHWQNGVAERYGQSWKNVWQKVVDDNAVMDEDILDAACAVSEARNTLRNRSGFSPRQWVFGTNGKLLTNLEDDEDYSSASAVTTDEKMGRKHNLKIAARTAFFELQNVDSLKRALSHKTRVQPRDYKPGELVYIYRQDPSGKKTRARWIGPAVIIGTEGSNYWAARGGRCLLAAREHLRPAEHSEVSLMLRIKAAINEVEKAMDNEFEDVVDEEAMAEMDISGIGDSEDETMEAIADAKSHHNVGGRSSSSSSGSALPFADRRRKAEEIEQKHKKIVKQAKLLDDVPMSVKENLKQGDSKEVFFMKRGLTGEALEKALDKEIPWHMIPHEERELFREAESKQSKEHIDFGAVKPLSVEESEKVEREVDKSRIITSRFLYRDKNRAKRRMDPNIACKAKARLCVGGQRDPDLGVVEMSVDAPTASRYSVLVGIMVALSRGWNIAVGDIRAAFLNGVEAPRQLFFRQPQRGIPGLDPRQLIEIVKGVFGLATSPKLWWLKLSTDLVNVKVEYKGESFGIEQNELDPCAFRVVEEKEKRVAGMIFTHVDDLMVMTEPGLDAEIKNALVKKFPIDEWEEGEFEYVGCEYKVTRDKVVVKQSVYAKTRVEKIVVPSGSNDDEEADADLIARNRSVVGALSWLAKQTRPDLQFAVAQAQRVQTRPTIGDIKLTNKIVEMARKHEDEGLVLRAVPEEKLCVFGFHDAAWGNVPVSEVGDADKDWEGDHAVGSQLGSLVFIGDKDCLANQECPCSFVDWRSKASTRVCRSTFAGETMACGDALEGALLLRAMLVSFLKGRLVKEEDAGRYVPMHLFTDCKSLYDHMHRDGLPKPPSEKRLAVELAAIRQSLAQESRHQWRRLHGDVPLRPDRPLKPPLRWLPTDQHWADVLTKKMSASAWWQAIGDGRARFPLMVPRDSQNT